MCGIYGITKRNTDFIKKYLKMCSYRGPDFENIFVNDLVTLGHNLLSITDNPNNGKQPWISPKGNILVFNGEIFNYFQLCKKYIQFKPKTSCDTELLAWGLDTFGLSFIDEIDSMHAFAFYQVNKDKIYLSRDHVGIKPLFYSDLGSCLVFGSEIKGLKDVVPTSRYIDHMSLSCWSYCGLNVTKNTFFRGIYKIMPGETIEYDLKTKKLKSIKRDLIIGGKGENYNKEEFIEIFDKSIIQCLIGKRNFGIFLSGGLDSTMIAHHVSKHKNIKAFTNQITPCPTDPNENYNSDCEEAVKFANLKNISHKIIDHSPNCYSKYWYSSEEALDEPMYNPNIPMYEQINKVMSENNIVVTLSGDMGDEILCGYPKYFKRGNFPDFSHRDVVSEWINHRLDLPPKIEGLTYTQNDVIDYLIETVFPEYLCDKNDLISSYMRLDQIGLCSEDYFRRNDRFGMKYSMEGRFPFASKLMMNYAMNIHSKFKFGYTDNEMKLMSRFSYKKILPDFILNKSKTGWTAPINLWREEYKNLCNKINNIANELSSTFKVELPQDKSWAPFLNFYTWVYRNGMKI